MKKSSLVFGLLGLLAIALVPTSSAHAQNTRTWVSGTGDDVNTCSRTQPCKTFAGAISKTNAGGEISCLDPSGYGPVTITKAITIDCGGTYGSILFSSVDAIRIVADPTDRVVLRNLSLNGAGTTLGVRGIYWVGGGELHVDRVTFENFSIAGIEVQKTGFGILTVRHSWFAKGPIGIKLATSSSGNLVASVSDSSFNSLTSNGIEASTNSFAAVNGSVFSTNNGSAILASHATSTVYARNNTIANSNVGINANAAGAKITASGNGIYGNSKAFNVVAGATFLSANNNEVDINQGTPATGSLVIK